MKYLAARACSTEELRLRLRRRALRPDDVESVIARLKDVGYLNDERFAESFANNRVANDGFGKMRVLTDLRSRRVPAKLAEQATAQAFDGKSESEMIDEFIERRMSSFSTRIAAGNKIDDDKELARAYRKLRRAGFASGAILMALKRVAARPELIDENPPDEGDEEEREATS